MSPYQLAILAHLLGLPSLPSGSLFGPGGFNIFIIFAPCQFYRFAEFSPFPNFAILEQLGGSKSMTWQARMTTLPDRLGWEDSVYPDWPAYP